MTEICTCRFCEGEFFQLALLEYTDSPQSAQGFLDSLEQQDKLVDLKIYQCVMCGLVQHSLSPVAYYRDVIRAIAYSESMRNFRVYQLSQWIKNYDLYDRKILEIGSGKGEYLDLLKKSGAKYVFGLENSEQSVNFARFKEFNVQQGYLSNDFCNPWPYKFDAFVIFSFIEHWPDLKKSLKQLLHILQDGAVGLVEVPNFDFIIKKGLYSEFTTDHIFYFQKKTLKIILEMSGFEVISVVSIWHDYILSAQVKKRIPLKTSNFIAKQSEIINQLQSFTAKFKPEEIVIWGAGHQALAVISLAQLNNKVSHIIDSASFKQKKYTPSSHMLIKSPETLFLDTPKAIVIMAAGYSDEVAQIITKEYTSIKHIAILREDYLEILKDGQ